ncbi:MAG: aminoacyl-tRNA hydrolase [Burkholderiales bacterium]|nr:MAG: aminoacyl-tRNA hydrolase [Burkholderiales bacterium]
MPIRLIVGLGNPGPDYEATRHNAGFWFADRTAERLGARFSHQSKFHGELARAGPGHGELWLLKPSTYMNRAGQSVAALARFYRIGAEEILVAHDELDLAPGTVRLKKGGGSGGHNGLRDITACLGTDAYWRLRIGIGHPRTLGLRQPVIDFVLRRPTAEERDAIESVLPRALEVLPLLIEGRPERALTKLHTTDPPRPEPLSGG